MKVKLMNKNELIIKLIGLRISLGLQSSGMSKDLANKQAREGIQKLYNTPELVLGTEEGTIVTIIETYMNSLLPYLVALGGENQDGGELDSNFQKALILELLLLIQNFCSPYKIQAFYLLENIGLLLYINGCPMRA